MIEVIQDSAPVSSRRFGRSALSVVAGLVTVAITSTAMDGILRATGVLPEGAHGMTAGLFLLATAYRCVFAVLGGYITARLAPARAEKHALVLGVIGTVLSLGGVFAALASRDLGPLWYPVLLVLTAIPCSVIGAKIRTLGVARSSVAA